MCTPNQVADDYVRLLAVWDNRIVPELGGLIGAAPLAWQNRTFVYVFDRFCHFIVVEVDQLGLSRRFARLGAADTAGRQAQFSDFLARLPQLAPQPEAFRESQYRFADAFQRRQQQPLREGGIRQFYKDIHAVGHGSYASQRLEAVDQASRLQLLAILELLTDQAVPIHQSIRRVLMLPPRGVKIEGLGPASMAEIPGWLFVDQLRKYPIVNGKFVKTLDQLGLYNAAASCF